MRVRASYRLTIRARPRVEKERFGELGPALDSVERRGRELEAEAHGQPAGGTLMRRLDPVQIVVARLELSGPRGLRAGVDVRGDGSSEAYTGRIRRRVIEQLNGESSYDARRREVA
jgi:hypothetical protein